MTPNMEDYGLANFETLPTSTHLDLAPQANGTLVALAGANGFLLRLPTGTVLLPCIWNDV